MNSQSFSSNSGGRSAGGSSGRSSGGPARSSGASAYRSNSSGGRQRPAFSAAANTRRGKFGGFSGGRGGSRGGSRGKGMGQYIDPSRFINKAVITEQIEHFVPEHSFQDFAVDAKVKLAVLARGYIDPTPIQDRTIPHILKRADIVGIANTGTGKTGAFLIPLIDKVVKNPREQVLIIVPTRELAIQIDQELKALTLGMKMFSVCCVGGAPIGAQIKQLHYQYNFIIGTPGRLKDLIDRRMIFLKEFNTVVLDEADRMLDMGFIKDMRAILAGMPSDRQTLFFSATLSSDIDKLINEFLKNPVKISVKTGDTSKTIDQDVVRVGGGNKIDVLHELLTKPGFNKVIIFGRTKHGVEKLSKELVRKGIAAESIHGNKNHSKRQQALKAFKDSQITVLVATDVAARGLDIPDVSHVINFDIPATYDDYVHRIGRTGRGGKQGKALTFI